MQKSMRVSRRVNLNSWVSDGVHSNFMNRNLIFIGKKMHEMSNGNRLSEQSMSYIINLLKDGVTQHELYDILNVQNIENENDKHSVLLSTSRQDVHDEYKISSNDASSPNNTELQENLPLLEQLFNQMNNSHDSNIRKMAAYILWTLTFNNSDLQDRIWNHFDFAPSNGIVILNTFPSRLISQHLR